MFPFRRQSNERQVKTSLNNIRDLFGKMVRSLRTAKGISQEKLAFACGLHRTYISDIERGTRNISIDNIQKIAAALDVNPKDLFDFANLSKRNKQGIAK
jgi:transcriptional regulator with XRE-family HTH domain